MLLFIAHQLISYLICFFLSILVFCVLSAFRNSQKAHKLGPVYGMIQAALEVSILVYCAGHGAYLLYGKRLVFMVYHQLFFVAMIFVVLFRLLRFVLHFFSNGKSGPSKQFVVSGGGMFRVKNDTGPSSPVKSQVVDMMSKMSDSKMVGNNEKIKPGDIEMYYTS